jgi:hypothetical protein
VRRDFGTGVTGMNRFAVAVDDKLVDRIFEMTRWACAKETSRIGFVVAEEELRRSFAEKPEGPQL